MEPTENENKAAGAPSGLNDELDEFVILKNLVNGLREIVPLQTERHRQDVGLYMLAALRFGKGYPEHLLFDDSKLQKKPALSIVVSNVTELTGAL